MRNMSNELLETIYCMINVDYNEQWRDLTTTKKTLCVQVVVNISHDWI